MPGNDVDDLEGRKSIERTTLLDALDKKIMVILTDDQILIGKLRAIDQFNNLVLHETVERIHVGTRYGEIERGVLLVRGENILMLGDYDPERCRSVLFTEIGIEEIAELKAGIEAKNRAKSDLRRRFYRAQGLTHYTERERFRMEFS